MSVLSLFLQLFQKDLCLHEAVANIMPLTSDIHQKRLSFWKNAYLKEKENILTDYQMDFVEYKKAREESQVQLECVHFALRDIAESQEIEAEEKHIQKLDEVRSAVSQIFFVKI